MQGFFEYIKKLAVKMVIDALYANSDALAKKIADKADIPLLSEKQEKELAAKFIDGVAELIEDLFEEKPKKNG